MTWKIGKIEIAHQVVLAPMAGVSNPAYIKIVEQMGLGLAITELISAEAIVRNNKKTFEMLKGIDLLTIPVGVQLFGSNAETLAKAAQIVTALYPNIFIDINMGCPVPKVALRTQAGSALLKDPEKVYEIVRCVVASVKVPVTVKIRSGWDHDHINAVEIAKICEGAGASAISVHGRTRSQGYSGKADWDIIKQVKEAVMIPVIGNGDVTSPLLAEEMLLKTGCDAVMIGRAAFGNPWLFPATISYLETGKLLDPPTSLEKVDMCIKHLQYLKKLQGDKRAAMEIRTHAAWYLKGLKKSSEIKQKIYQTLEINDIMQLLNEYRIEIQKEM